MIAGWSTSKLRDLAVIRVSNVDKKSYATERPVWLCNYMDVYANEYVTSAIDFMHATASPAEIERFGLQVGDVVITKDSETPDDIGVPAVIAEDIDQLVCGYHLALLRPKAGQLHPIFLAKQLASSSVVKYFAANATGSTRFGLGIGIIEKCEILSPEFDEQSTIAEVLYTVDQAIEQTEALIAKQQRIKTGLMQDLLTRGIDEHGDLRSEQTHEFKDSPLGRIPAAWDVVHLNQCVATDAPICYGILMPGRGYDNGVPVIKVKDIFDGRILQDSLLLTDPRIDRKSRRSRLRAGDLLITIRGTTGRVAVVPPELDRANITQDTARIRLADEFSTLFFYFTLQSRVVQDQVALHTIGQAVKGINIGDVKRLGIILPSLGEQNQIADRLESIDAAFFETTCQLHKLTSLKAGLMQDLLTGTRRVTALLEPHEAVMG